MLTNGIDENLIKTKKKIISELFFYVRFSLGIKLMTQGNRYLFIKLI